MTPAEFAGLVVACNLSLPAGIPVERLQTYAQVESGLNPAAISPPNRNGTRDYGLLQINEVNFARFGVDARSIMEPCTNLRVGVAILAEADRAAACIYNTGKPGCRNGYPERIQAAAARRIAAPVAAPAPAPTDQPAPTASWDVWAAPVAEPVPAVPAERPEAPAAEEPRLIVELTNGD